MDNEAEVEAAGSTNGVVVDDESNKASDETDTTDSKQKLASDSSSKSPPGSKLPARQQSAPVCSYSELEAKTRLQHAESTSALSSQKDVDSLASTVDGLSLRRSISEVNLHDMQVRQQIRQVYPLGYCNVDIHGRPVKVFERTTGHLFV